MKKRYIRHASELVTCQGKAPKFGKEMADIGLIRDGAVIIHDDKIIETGTTEELDKKVNLDSYPLYLRRIPGRRVFLEIKRGQLYVHHGKRGRHQRHRQSYKRSFQGRAERSGPGAAEPYAGIWRDYCRGKKRLRHGL